MERLWTPWRMSYVSGSAAGTTSHAPSAGGADQPAARAAPESDTAGQAPLAAPGCFLCATAAAPAAHDAENLVLHRAELGFVVLNLYPYNTGHVMIAPYAHVGD